MKKVNELVICKEDYESVKDFKNAVKKAIFVLLDNNYIMTVDCAEMDIVVIHYDDAEKIYGDYYPYWLSPEEEESVAYKNE